jgi:hypothetical protein
MQTFLTTSIVAGKLDTPAAAVCSSEGFVGESPAGGIKLPPVATGAPQFSADDSTSPGSIEGRVFADTAAAVTLP